MRRLFLHGFMRYTAVSVLALLLALQALLLSGCKKGEDEPVAQTDDYAGFALSGAQSGGGVVADANLNVLDLSQTGGDTVIALDFVSDSALSGEGVQRDVANPPKYKVYMLDEPYRLVVEFEQLSYWDYERELDISSAPFIRGVFNHSPEQGGLFKLYFQLQGEAAYMVNAEDGSSVTVTLRPVKAQPAQSPEPTETIAQVNVLGDEAAPEGSAFYVVANAYYDYCSGVVVLGDDEMTPVLASDMKNVMLISKGFDAKGEAEALMQRILAREGGAVPADWSVELLEKGALPEYSADMDYMAAFDVTPARIDGAPAALDVAVPDGLFLSMTPERDGLLYSRRITEYEPGGSVAEYEVLCIQFLTGETRQLFEFKFQTVESAKYSPDGRRLAVLERSGESAHLYIFDVDSRDLITDLSSMGFGDTVSAYCWDSMGGRVFSIGGSNEIVVNQYDFNVPSESKRFTVVDKKGVDESALAFYDGEVYFCESSLEEGAQMYRVKPEGGLRRGYLAADSFAFSEDGRYLAYADNKSDYAEDTAAQEPVFAVTELATGETRNIDAGFKVYTYLWSKDASRIYYFENMLTGDAGEDTEGSTDEKDPYPYRLWVYDMATGESKAVADLASTNIGVSNAGNTVYICYTDPETLGNVVRATYTLNIPD